MIDRASKSFKDNKRRRVIKNHILLSYFMSDTSQQSIAWENIIKKYQEVLSMTLILEKYKS